MTPSSLDHSALDRLLDEVGGDVVARDRFITDFIDMWEGRLARLRAAVDRADAAEALVVMRSIRVSAEMVGATALRMLAEEESTRLRGHPFEAIDLRLGGLAALGQRACHELARFIGSSSRTNAG